MKTVLLAGGYGTRISEETESKPKPMIEIGGKPILWHIMKLFSFYGHNDFVICCGYKGHAIKDYFLNYASHMSDIEVDLGKNNFTTIKSYAEPWKITLIDTGVKTMTGGRLAYIHEYIKDEEDFFMTYGDGVSNVNISDLYKFHSSHGKLASMTIVTPPGRFGSVELENNKVKSFIEKPAGDNGFINGGFFVLKPKAIENYIDGPDTIWERDPLEKLVKDEELFAYKHKDFWQPMDTLRDKRLLDEYWSSGKAPWKLW
tara:strand:+ start:205 stop:978 length:774 start_codon:yes stop_codon:yes gene_type:complete